MTAMRSMAAAGKPRALPTSRTALREGGDHVAHHGGVLPAVAIVYALDHLLASAREKSTSMSGMPPRSSREALEQQVVPDRIDLGDSRQ
jgi:hypothetical protein